MQINTKIVELLKSKLTSLGVSNVILFGSRAIDKATDFSDYDILAIFNEEIGIKKKMDIAREIRKDMAKQLVDIDILVKSKGDVEIGRNQIGNVLRNAMLEGIYL